MNSLMPDVRQGDLAAINTETENSRVPAVLIPQKGLVTHSAGKDIRDAIDSMFLPREGRASLDRIGGLRGQSRDTYDFEIKEEHIKEEISRHTALSTACLLVLNASVNCRM